MSDVLCSEQIPVAGGVGTYVLLIAYRIRLREKLNFADARSYDGNQVLIGFPDTAGITINLWDHKPVKKEAFL